MADDTDRSFRQDGLTTRHLQNELGKALTTNHLAGRLGGAAPPQGQGGGAHATPERPTENAPAPAAAVSERNP